MNLFFYSVVFGIVSRNNVLCRASILVHDLVVSTGVLNILGFVFFCFFASLSFLDLILRDFRLDLTGKISNGCVVGRLWKSCGGRLLTVRHTFYGEALGFTTLSPLHSSFYCLFVLDWLLLSI